MGGRAELTTPNDVIAEIFDAQAIAIGGSGDAVLATRAEGPVRAIHDHGSMALPPPERDAWRIGTEDIAQLLAQPPRGDE